MTAPTDPVISLRALSDKTGAPLYLLRAWVREGFLPSAGRGKTTLLAALRGILDALDADAEDDTPYRVSPQAIPAGHIPVAEADARLSVVTAAFDAALADALTAVERAASDALRPPVSAEGRKAARPGAVAPRRRIIAPREIARLPPGRSRLGKSLGGRKWLSLYPSACWDRR